MVFRMEEGESKEKLMNNGTNSLQRCQYARKVFIHHTIMIKGPTPSNKR